MTQPKFAPILANDSVRELSKLPAPESWSPHRPADFRARPGVARLPGQGAAGPDQGYALLLAERLGPQVHIGDSEHLDDVLRGAAVLAMRRSSLYGRAPVRADLELALTLFGFLDSGASAAVREARTELFRGVAHSYQRERHLADLVPDSTLRMTPAAVVEHLAADEEAFAELSGLSAGTR